MHSSQEVQQLTTVPELELFLLEHGEEVIDMLGQQVDRIEKNIKVRERYHVQWYPVVLAKTFYNLCVYYVVLSDTTIKGTGQIFWCPECN